MAKPVPDSCWNHLLRNKRKERHWTIENVSARVDVDTRTYRRWEHGEQRPHLHALKRLCTLFECSAEDLGYPIDSLTSATTGAARTKKPQQTMEKLHKARPASKQGTTPDTFTPDAVERFRSASRFIAKASRAIVCVTQDVHARSTEQR